MQFDPKLLTCSLLLALTVGCSDHNKPRSAATAASMDSEKDQPAHAASPAAHAAASTNAKAPRSPMGRTLPDPLRGKVLETLDAGGYTYVLLSVEQGDVWAAARHFTVKEGDEVEVAGMSLMRNFRSQTLNRTFKEIQFAGRARRVSDNPPASTAQTNPAPGGMPRGHPSIGQPTAAAKPMASAPVAAAEVKPLAGGMTVASLFESKAALAGKTVRFRGRVVKANRAILGVNWLHIEDGTGGPGTDDITVTSPTDFAALGTLVVVEGTVALDKDFGSGYAYDVIVEKATVTAESP